jgi:hypothetical protein
LREGTFHLLSPFPLFFLSCFFTYPADNDTVSTADAVHDLAETADARLKERLLGMAARRSPVVLNGRFFYSRDLNALTYWYEDHTQSTRMVYVETGL